MAGKIVLSSRERKRCLHLWHFGAEPRRARRALVLLRLDEGASYREIQRTCHVSSDLIAAVTRQFRTGGVAAVLAPAGSETAVPGWMFLVLVWLRDFTPRALGFFRSRWTCGVLVILLGEQRPVRISPETVRRQPRRQNDVWRRPRPGLGPVDPAYDQNVRGIQELLRSLPADETAVFQDEGDVHLNPKIGSMWMPRGAQGEVETPGNNVQRHLAGSLVWRTSTLIVSPPGTRRNTALFLAHLDDLRRRRRTYRKIHVICNNAAFHKSRAVQKYLQQGGHRLELHFLPTYAPETNPIERVWWHLHETITRNHQCTTIEELLREVYDWFAAEQFFPIETSLYRLAA
jgi:putative transposase